MIEHPRDDRTADLHSINKELDALALDNDARQGERVLKAVYDYLGRFVAYPSEHAHVAHALWVIHTHLMDRWESTPRLAFLSAEPGSGKTRALEATEPLVPSPVHAVNVSAAYLFRKVGDQETRVTILFDEVDTLFGPKAKENEELRGLLNAGHRRGAVAGRCVVRGKTIETEEIPAYAPVALAGIGWLPDTLLSRSIVVRMRRRHAGESAEPFRRRLHGPQGENIRESVRLWAASVPTEIIWPELPPKIQDRDADVWEPLVAVADLVGGDWPKRGRAAAVALVADSKNAELSLGLLLLGDLRRVFDANASLRDLPSKIILDALYKLEESPWADLRGRPLDERGLSRRLKEYGIRSKTLRVGPGTPRGYSSTDFFDAWARYLPAKTDDTDDTDTTSSPDAAASGPDPDEWSFNYEQEAVIQ